MKLLPPRLSAKHLHRGLPSIVGGLSNRGRIIGFDFSAGTTTVPFAGLIGTALEALVDEVVASSEAAGAGFATTASRYRSRRLSFTPKATTPTMNSALPKER